MLRKRADQQRRVRAFYYKQIAVGNLMKKVVSFLILKNNVNFNQTVREFEMKRNADLLSSVLVTLYTHSYQTKLARQISEQRAFKLKRFYFQQF